MLILEIAGGIILGWIIITFVLPLLGAMLIGLLEMKDKFLKFLAWVWITGIVYGLIRYAQGH